MTVKLSVLKSYTFSSEVWKYPTKDGKGGWFFIHVDSAASKSIKKMTELPKRGFGSVPVIVSIGTSRWRTSIFPDSKTQTYLLPLKAQVRKAENIDVRSKIIATIEIIGVPNN